MNELEKMFAHLGKGAKHLAFPMAENVQSPPMVAGNMPIAIQITVPIDEHLKKTLDEFQSKYGFDASTMTQHIVQRGILSIKMEAESYAQKTKVIDVDPGTPS